MQNCLGDSDALLVAPGEISDQTPAGVLETAARLGLFHGLRCCVLAKIVQMRTVAEILVDGKFTVQGRQLGQVSELALGCYRILEQIAATDAYRALAWRQHTADHLHGGGFAGAIGAQKTKHLTTADPEVQSLNGMDVTVASMEVRDLDQALFAHGALLFAATRQNASGIFQSIRAPGLLRSRFPTPDSGLRAHGRQEFRTLFTDSIPADTCRHEPAPGAKMLSLVTFHINECDRIGTI